MAKTAATGARSDRKDFRRRGARPQGFEAKSFAGRPIQHRLQRQLCAIALLAEGWRPDKLNAHYRTISAMPLILGPTWQKGADYLDACRSKRNGLEYDAAGRVSTAEAKELREFAVELRTTVVDWLNKKHPKLSPWSK